MEQIRIVKEMRERDGLENGRPVQLRRPRFMVWENVPGAFSSAKGADFAAVLEEILKIIQENAKVDVPEGGWPHSGCVFTEDGRASVAWRLHDAQFWGVPQRRKRIALVADFGGLTAPEILFERKGLSRDTESCGETGQRTAAGAEESAGGASLSFQERAGKPGGAKGFSSRTSTPELSRHSTTRAFSLQGGGVTSQNSQGSAVNEDVSFTLNAIDHHGVAYGFDGSMGASAGNIGYEEEKAMTSKSSGGGTASFAVDCRNGKENPCINGTLQAKSNGGISYNLQNVVRTVGRESGA